MQPGMPSGRGSADWRRANGLSHMQSRYHRSSFRQECSRCACRRFTVAIAQDRRASGNPARDQNQRVIEGAPANIRHSLSFWQDAARLPLVWKPTSFHSPVDFEISYAQCATGHSL